MMPLRGWGAHLSTNYSLVKTLRRSTTMSFEEAARRRLRSFTEWWRLISN